MTRPMDSRVSESWSGCNYTTRHKDVTDFEIARTKAELSRGGARGIQARPGFAWNGCWGLGTWKATGRAFLPFTGAFLQVGGPGRGHRMKQNKRLPRRSQTGIVKP